MFRAYAELLRLPNVFTAMADVVMGFFFVGVIAGSGDATVLGLLIGASSLLYLAGMVLNDVFDFEVDSRERPSRPLPSGRISRPAAARLGWGLLAGGVALGMLAGAFAGQIRPAIAAATLASGVVFYDGYLKRTPLGPLGMGGCRMLNVLLGMSAAAGWGIEHVVAAAGMGVYIVGVTCFARDEATRSARFRLVLGIAIMMLGVALLAWLPTWTPLGLAPGQWRWFMAILGLLIAWQCRRAVLDPSPYRVQTAVKQCILSLVILDAAVAMAVRGPMPAMVILLLLVPTVVLGQWVYST
jgi:4-hydroxybenzoate polyprenyltransferase